MDLTAWIVIAVIVLSGTAVGFSVFLESVQYIGPVKSTLIGCLEPVSSMVFSVAALKTQISWAEWIGFVLLLCTVFLSVSEKEDGCRMRHRWRRRRQCPCCFFLSSLYRQ